MQSITLPIEIPQDLLIAVNSTEKALIDTVKTVTAAYLYKERKLTLGKAIELSGLSRFEFEQFLQREEIPINSTTLEDVLSDIDKLKGV